ncbi:hypothetical protein PTKIN_Ptkin08bG0033000 [Pterospermum kingtungense]
MVELLTINRQTFIGGNYAPVDATTFTPNPDYYVSVSYNLLLILIFSITTINFFICLTCCFFTNALLWHRLMGSNVLFVTQKVDPHLRVYAHFAKKKPGISLLFINLSKDKTFNVTLSNDDNPRIGRRNLKSKDAVRLVFEFKDIQSDIVCLNDIPLNPTDSLDIPAMDPMLIDASSPISIVSHSIVFVTIRDFNAPACA